MITKSFACISSTARSSNVSATSVLAASKAAKRKSAISFTSVSLSSFQEESSYCLGFDVAASGQGDLAVIYIDEVKGEDLWLRALFSCRTEDWHFLQTVLFKFLRGLQSVAAAGDSSGLGRQICWEASQQFGSRFGS